MKSATIRVALELREAAQSVLESGESLSAFTENSLRVQIERRRSQKSFLERGLASRDEGKRSGQYHAVDDVLKELDQILADTKSVGVRNNYL